MDFQNLLTKESPLFMQDYFIISSPQYYQLQHNLDTDLVRLVSKASLHSATWLSLWNNQHIKQKNNIGSGGIRTHASEETGA